MTGEKKGIVKGVLTGVIIGTAVGMVAIGSMKPKKKTIKYKTANALDTVGTIMQNIADYTR